MTVKVIEVMNGWTRVEDEAWVVRATISPRGIVHPSKLHGTYQIPRMIKVLEKCFEIKKERGM